MSGATLAALLLAGLLAGCASNQREPTPGGSCYIGTEQVSVGEPVALATGPGKRAPGWWITDRAGNFFVVNRARLSACMP